MGIQPDSDVQFLKGVGPRRADQLARLGIKTVGDLLFHFPQRYEDRTTLLPIAHLTPGEVQTTTGVIESTRTIRTRGRRQMFQATIRDATGIMSAVWFSVRGDYLKKKYQTGMTVTATGRVGYSRYNNCFEMPHPEMEPLDENEDPSAAGIRPVYPLTEGINQKVMQKIVAAALEHCPPLPELLPEDMRTRLKLPERNEALKSIHAPAPDDDAQKLNAFATRAQKRMIFEEFFIIECAMALYRVRTTEQAEGVQIKTDETTGQAVLNAFPFTLTPDQQKALAEIKRDLATPHPMNRLLQGDVGSGKTAVAAASMMMTAARGYQAAMMAPTEILAEQHYNNLLKFDNPLGLKAELLTSGMKAKEKNEAKARIAAGEVDLIIGTHAIIQQRVDFKNLGLAVVDEQHRFGVRQRAELVSKGPRPNMLIMTATPIPRTLAMTVYSDLDVSIIKSPPKGRGEVETRVIQPKAMDKAHVLMHREVAKGRQAYIIYPLVEESEKSDLKAATDMYENYRTNIFPDLRVGLVHGRMKQGEKNAVMHAFMKKEIDVLVSTTVVEVGIDQPNATVMMVEHSERFGLAQLHQLRGRVGRGADKSYCLLAIEYPVSDIARERLKVMTQTTDGFVIAEKDLHLRGTGDLFGTKQSGLPTFRIANLLRDFKALKAAKDEAFSLIHTDPALSSPALAALKKELQTNWQEKFQLADIG